MGLAVYASGNTRGHLKGSQLLRWILYIGVFLKGVMSFDCVKPLAKVFAKIRKNFSAENAADLRKTSAVSMSRNAQC